MSLDKENIILVDYDVDEKWQFLKILDTVTKEKWNIKKHITNHLHGSLFLNLLRFFWYFFFPLLILIRRKQYNRVIGWQQFYGLNFAFWSRLFGLKKINDLTVMTFIYKKKEGLKGKLYHKYMSYIVTSKYIDRFICFAKEECHYYSGIFGTEESKFIYVPLGYSITTEVPISDEGYVFSTGRSNRDYDFLVSSLKNTDFQLIIACDSYHTTLENAENIEVLNDCHGNETFQLMAKCHCVVIPLKNLNMSSGQLVVLQAMSLGKPVICTASDGIKDYVEHGVTGLLVNNDKESWHEALRQLYASDGCYEEMSKNAKAVYHRDFTEERMFQRISNVVNGEVW